MHILTVSWPYVDGAVRHLEPVLRAYVEDVAERRGCTDTALPPKSDYREGS
ncbi:hypothetical protein LUW77_15135 [Streptomyces radiopugnans]|nr:hypothetical protein LUW77_15135 [Streptomyces radiopugnans]